MTPTESLLSAAERGILAKLIDGCTNIAIARALDVSNKTVKNHISHILAKARCSSRLQLTVRVYKERKRELKRRPR